MAVKQGPKWLEQSVPAADLAYYVKQLRNVQDVYLTQNRFWAFKRRIAYLSALDCVYSDLDFYAIPELAGRRPEDIVELALLTLEDAHIPSPSVAVSSGRGLALLWLHTPAPRQALPRWNACQRAIFEALKHLGADARARDPARVLRLIGTTNSKNGAQVQALTPAREPWGFDDLANEILPVGRAELVDLRIQRALRKPAAIHRPGPQGFNQATLWEARLSALQKLRQLRWFGHLPPGQRDTWLFLTVTAMSWIAIPTVLRREAFALAVDCGGWTESEAHSRLSTVIHRATMAAKGQKVLWNGLETDPRYHFKDETIIEWLKITADEQREMPAIWGPEVSKEKDRERWHRRREAAGGVDRATYLAEALTTSKPWEALGMSRRTWYRNGMPVPGQVGTGPSC